ncbi:AzlC family ABC transporter permease [Chitinibacter tainanensis]|uniref:AzlC family ABC transporter permease n=1 Tax=Chitinibacter tainanensis TaxID=230667 RepID=UPI0023555BCD|nr:AzlC family ABC transporter permease [Chitinibacter tainanensis]
MPAPHSARAALRAGFQATLPMQMGVAPFGLIFGALAISAGLPGWAAVAMSLLVYAGSAQFLAVSLLASGADWPLIVFTTMIVNLRHALYSASLHTELAPLPFWQRAGLAYFLTDETFAAMQLARQQQVQPLGVFMLGSGLCNGGSWLLSTIAGVLLGQSVPGLASWGLEFAMVATFTGIVVPLLINRAQIAACVAAGLTSLLTLSLPYKLGLLLAVLAGIWAGMLVANRGGAALAGVLPVKPDKESI